MREQPSIDLNADMGEYAHTHCEALEAALMAVVTSCNIACGGHTGTEDTMIKTLALAKAKNVRCGAHPAYPDREGFGRRSVDIGLDELEASISDQLDHLKICADKTGIALGHIKPHGALYNDAAQDLDLARMVGRVTLTRNMVLMGPPGSALETAALELSLPFIAEGFIDRAYEMNGALVARSHPHAMIETNKARTEQALRLARGQALDLPQGRLTLTVHSLCIHSDTQGALETATCVRAALEEDGFVVRAVERAALGDPYGATGVGDALS